MNEQEYKECPHCGEEIKIKAIKCKHCHSFLDPAEEQYVSPGAYERKGSVPSRGEIPPEPQEAFQEPEYNFSSKGKGFLISLFDVNMTEMVTPKIIRGLYILGLLAIGLGMFTVIISSIITVGITGFGRIFLALITAPIGALIAVIFLRVYLELIILLFNIYDQLKDMKTGLLRQEEGHSDPAPGE